MSKTKKNSEEILIKLLECFYYDTDTKGLSWRYQEGVTIGEILGKDFEKVLFEYIHTEEKNEQKRD